MCRHGENIYLRKDGRYEGRYLIGHKEGGRPQYGYVYSSSFYEARTKLVEKRIELASVKGAPGPSILLKHWFAKWLEENVRLHVKSSTFVVYQRHINTYIIPRLGHLYLTEIDAATLNTFIADLRHDDLADSTISCIWFYLDAVLDFACKEKQLSKNPCDGVRFRSNPSHKRKVLTDTERDALLKAITPDDLPILLALLTGLRLGEVCGLKWSDIDWNNKTISIDRTVLRLPSKDGKGKSSLCVLPPKTKNSYRTVPLSNILINELVRLKAAIPTSEYIFGKKDRPAEPRTIQRHLKNAAKRAGISDIHFHLLRHDFITRLVEQGAHVNVVREIAGHSSVSTTLETYTHISIESARKIIESISVTNA